MLYLIIKKDKCNTTTVIRFILDISILYKIVVLEAKVSKCVYNGQIVKPREIVALMVVKHNRPTYIANMKDNIYVKERVSYFILFSVVLVVNAFKCDNV